MEIVVIGGGIAGITACYNFLAKNKDIKIHLIEKNTQLGGLAKSFKYKDKFVFDIGPKRFHTEDQEVKDFLCDIGKHISMITIDRLSKVFFLNKYFLWPLNRSDIFKMPFPILAKVLIDLIFKNKNHSRESIKFENYIVSHYGKTLYEIFFKPYTEKFLHIPIENIHSDWANTGIDRSIINKEHKGSSLLELIQQILLPPKVEANFLYPERGGLGAFLDACINMIEESKNVVIEKNTTVKNIISEDGKITLLLSSGKTIQSDYIFWSGKLPDLLESIGENKTDYHLPYTDTIFIDLVIENENIIKKEAICQWLYISAAKYHTCRISFPKRFNKNNIPGNYEGICAEITIREDRDDPDHCQIAKLVLDELMDMRVFTKKIKIEHCEVHRESATYPIYHTNYKNEVEKAFKKIERFSDRIIPFGRSGSFWYNNMDHAIKQALALSSELLKGNRPEFHFRKYFGGKN